MAFKSLKIKEIILPTKKVFCHLLNISDTKILINCGTNNDLDTAEYNSIKEELESIDFILFNHFNVNFVGGLPFLFKNGFRGKVYATMPIKSFGKFNLLEHFNNALIKDQSINYALNDIENSFNEIQTIKYLQPIELGENIQITAYNSGFGLGGTIWKVTKDDESFLFGIYFDHKKSNHLNGIDFSLPKNTTFFCDSSYILERGYLRKDRNQEIKEILMKYLKGNKKMLLIVDYSEFIELSLILDDLLIQINTNNKTYKANCIGFNAKEFSESIKGMIEWSGDILLKEFVKVKENPFNFKFIKFYDNFTEMNEENIYICFSEEIFAKKIIEVINEDENNVIINFIGKKIKENTKICEKFVFERKETKKSVKLESSSSFSEEEVVEKKMHWYENDNEVYIKNEELFFPVPKRHKKTDEYNKVIPYDLTKQESKELKIEVENENEENKEIKEEIKIIKESFILKNKVLFYDLKSISDFNSSLNVLENILPKRIVLLKTEENLSKVFFYTLKYHKMFEEVFLLENQLELFSQKGHMIVNLDSSFNDKNYKLINDALYLGFKGIVVENALKFVEESKECFVIGELNFTEFKKRLLEKGIIVEFVNENRICICKEVTVEIKDGGVYIEGWFNSL